jgi:hypothetical protein
MSLALGEPGASGWGLPATLPSIGRQPYVAVNSRADVLVGWAEPPRPDDESLAVRAAVRSAGAPWGPVGVFGSGGQTQSTSLQLTLDEAGRAYLGWNTGSISVEKVGHAATGSASGWPATGGLATHSGSLAAGPDGTALFLSGAPEVGLEAASYDGGPPVRVRTTIRGRWDARARVARWTLRLRNAGRGSATGVSVGVGLDTAQSLVAARPRALVSPVPPQFGGGRMLTWRPGKITPGALRTIRFALREKPTPKPGTLVQFRASVTVARMGRTYPLGALRVPGR